MKSTAVWALVLVNVLLLGLLLGRQMKPNAAVAQVAGRPGDYIILPVDFPGATIGSIVVLDNVNGVMSAIQTDEATKRMSSIAPVNVADLFARNASRVGPSPRR